MQPIHRLAAILAADVAGYSRLIGADEGGTLERLRALRRELLDPKIAEHRGRLVKTTGDGLLVEFGSVVVTLRCAVDVQREMAGRNTSVPPDNRIDFRIDINVGDIVVEDGDIFGDGVNVAARLEALAEPGGICVAARVQEDATGKLDLAFEDIGEQQLKNIARPVRAFRAATTARPPIAQPGGGPSLPDKPSIAVLPFANMSGDPEQEYFADGMVEEIITALSRIRWLFVIVRNSSFAYKGQAIDVKRVGRELGVRYVLEGSVRKAGGCVRITAQLIEVTSGAHLGADRFNGSHEDVFDLQDEVASSVAGVIQPALQAAETARSASRPTSDLTACDLYLRAHAMFLSSAKQIPAALHLLERAIARDPRYGPALAWAAFLCGRLLYDDRSENRKGDSSKGADFARRAPEVAGSGPDILATAAPRAGLFWRGHRCHDGTGRPRLGPQPEFRPRLAQQGSAQVMGGPTRHCDRSFRGVAAPQPARPRRAVAHCHRLRVFSKSEVRGSGVETVRRDSRGSQQPKRASPSRRLLRPHGSHG